MAKINGDVLCKYCLGCERLNNEYFAGIRNCKTFEAGYENWRKLYIDSLKKLKKE